MQQSCILLIYLGVTYDLTFKPPRCYELTCYYNQAKNSSISSLKTVSNGLTSWCNQQPSVLVLHLHVLHKFTLLLTRQFIKKRSKPRGWLTIDHTSVRAKRIPRKWWEQFTNGRVDKHSLCKRSSIQQQPLNPEKIVGNNKQVKIPWMNLLSIFTGIRGVKQQQTHQHEHFQLKECTRRCHTTCTRGIIDYISSISFAHSSNVYQGKWQRDTQRNVLTQYSKCLTLMVHILYRGFHIFSQTTHFETH